jgi:hypothetical protein
MKKEFLWEVIMGMIKHIKKIPSFHLLKEHVSLLIVIQLSLILFIFIPPINAQTKVMPISGQNDWIGLIDSLSKAKMAGINIYVSLLPPSKTPPICPTCNYSEPYRLDFMQWAKEIANLSLRYSNLTGYAIEDFQENLNLGYIRQTYIDSMEAESKSINPKLQFITSLPNIYYVDKNSHGNGSGSNWTNAATAVSALNWASIKGGDTVYISGGTDSLTYVHDSVYAKYITGGVVTITSCKDTGHNGKVIYLADKTYASGFAFGILNSRNIKVTGLTFKWLRDNLHNYTQSVYVYGSSNCYLDNSHIINDGHGCTLAFTGDTSISITNNYIEYLTNSYMDAVAQNDQDGIDVGGGAGGHTITGNTIILRGLVGGSWHIDGLQWYKEGSTANLQSVIANNFIYYNAQTATGTNSGIYVSGDYTNRLLIYNNIIVLNTTSMDGIQLVSNPGYHLSTRIYNNTVLLGSTASTGMVFTALDTLIMENNIVVNDRTSSKEILMMDATKVGYFVSDYNQWYSRNRAWNNWTETIDQTFATWQGLGYDTHSQNSVVNFANSWGTNIADYTLSSGFNTGIDLSAYFTTDIRGVARPQGASWHVGALESQ